jgi:hypothetical protein
MDIGGGAGNVTGEHKRTCVRREWQQRFFSK